VRRATIAATLAATALHGPAVSAAGSPCAVSWGDPQGDTTYGLVVAVPLQDRDLDVLGATVRVTPTHLVETVKVDRLDAAGPDYGTGHGVGLYLTKYGKALSFSARRDATYGDRARATGDTAAARTPVTFVADPATSTFTLSVARADVARLSASADKGLLTGIGGLTIRSDHLAGAGDAAGSTESTGTSADTAVQGDGATISLDACDARLRRTGLVLTACGGTVTATLRDGDGGPLAGAALAVTANGRTTTVRTDAAGRAAVRNARGLVRVAYAGVPGRLDPAIRTVRA